MPAGVPDGDRELALLARQFGVEQELGHAEYAIHRRADLVAHGRQELRLRALPGAGLLDGGAELRFLRLAAHELRAGSSDPDEPRREQQLQDARSPVHRGPRLEGRSEPLRRVIVDAADGLDPSGFVEHRDERADPDPQRSVVGSSRNLASPSRAASISGSTAS
jgi:hypothetical protein